LYLEGDALIHWHFIIPDCPTPAASSLLQAGRVVYDRCKTHTEKLDSYMTLKISNPRKMVVGWLKRVITIFGLCIVMLSKKGQWCDT